MDLTLSSNTKLWPKFCYLTLFLMFGVLMHIPTQNLGRYGLYVYYNEFFWIGLFFFVFLFFSLVKIEKFKFSQYSAGFLLISSLLLIRLIDAFDLSNSWRILVIFITALYIFILDNSPPRERLQFNLTYFFVFSSLVESIFSIFQFYFLFDTDFYPKQLVGQRPFGVFQQVNIMGVYASAGFFSAFYFIRKYHSVLTEHKLMRGMAYLVICITPLVLFLTASRAAILSFLVGVCCLLPIIFKEKSEKYFEHIKRCFLISVILTLVAVVTNGGGTRSVESLSGALRLPMWDHTLWMISKHPLLGWGLGSFDTAYVTSLAERYEGLATIHERFLYHPHNEILFWLAEVGVIFSVPVFGFAIYVFYQIYKTNSQRDFLVALSCILPFAIHSMLEFPFYQSIPHWFYFVSLVWIFSPQMFIATSIKLTWPSKFFGCGLSVLGVLFMVTAFYSAHNILLSRVGKQPAAIYNVTNPFPFYHHYFYLLYSNTMYSALSNGDSVLAAEMVKNIQAESKYIKAPGIYMDIIYANQKLGKHAEAIYWSSVGSKEFPSDTLLKSDQIDNLIKYIDGVAGEQFNKDKN
ncbi:O-antigen ligase C-terminal domain-containing protein [Shewanella avicenniae]|uniref:O-antigen ligase C-terminal domain-containing protein n=1 Tax=Shewanella avicenniae TaxID=2814294 RepID=A0ABX7QRB5_9GAMM|nr:O-antigen ligase family protein [Shewanella avicenniae]QSX34002.1 O-antigen ligase C-terminal domain-containing protein [Shewanella avicenniae]